MNKVTDPDWDRSAFNAFVTLKEEQFYSANYYILFIEVE